MSQNVNSNGHGPTKSKKSRAKWTIMIYLAGDGNLTAHCITVLQQLEAVGSYRDDVRLLACFDSNTPAPKGSRYLEISRKRGSVEKQYDWELHEDLISPDDRPGHSITPPNFCESPRRSRGPAQSRPVAAEGVKRFINWTMENYDADRYMLIFFGHGPIVASQTFLAKENPPSSLRLTDLRKVLGQHFGPKNNRKLNILACNNCMMNGVETAVEVKDHVEFMIGSQGLVLAAGWPYEKMIGAVVKDPDAPTETIARKMLEACARNLIDFTLMDRSSEQAVCDLTKLSEKSNAVKAVKNLVAVLNDSLAFKQDDGRTVLRYPAICDAVKLARLEAQSYWGETFVDLVDFCERLLQKCDEMAKVNANLLKELGLEKECRLETFRNTDFVRRLRKIVRSSLAVITEVNRMIPESYYIGPELQYSRGLSIYFPWTRPEAPYFFTSRPHGRDYWLRTAFETYRGYRFAKRSGWTTFLESFFRATLRRVRRAERTFVAIDKPDSIGSGLIGESFSAQPQVLAIDLQKSSSDTGRVDHEVWSSIKNYPRRNYLSPADCPRKIDRAGILRPGDHEKFQDDKNPPVSYLGWNITGVVANVITPASRRLTAAQKRNGKSARSRAVKARAAGV